MWFWVANDDNPFRNCTINEIQTYFVSGELPQVTDYA